MFPTLTSYDVTNVLARYIIVSRYDGITFAERGAESDFNNVVGSKFFIVMLLAFNSFSVFITIGKIINACIPSQIAHMVIETISVIVTRFHSFWTRPNKSNKYKLMDKCKNMPFIIKKTDAHISTAFVKSQFLEIGFIKRFTRIFALEIVSMVRTYSTKVANLISWINGDRLPCFFHKSFSPLNKMPSAKILFGVIRQVAEGKINIITGVPI